MHDVFIKDFESNVGESVGSEQQLISVERLDPAGLFDEAVALRVLQGGSVGLVSSTVIDFRVGRILGVAFVGAVGDHPAFGAGHPTSPEPGTPDSAGGARGSLG